MGDASTVDKVEYSGNLIAEIEELVESFVSPEDGFGSRIDATSDFRLAGKKAKSNQAREDGETVSITKYNRESGTHEDFDLVNGLAWKTAFSKDYDASTETPRPFKSPATHQELETLLSDLKASKPIPFVEYQ